MNFVQNNFFSYKVILIIFLLLFNKIAKKLFPNRTKIIKLFTAKKFNSKSNFLFQEAGNGIHFDSLNKKAEPTGRLQLFYCFFCYCRSVSKAIMNLLTGNNSPSAIGPGQTLPSPAPWWVCSGLALKLFPVIPIPTDWPLERLTVWQKKFKPKHHFCYKFWFKRAPSISCLLHFLTDSFVGLSKPN